VRSSVGALMPGGFFLIRRLFVFKFAEINGGSRVKCMDFKVVLCLA
jgi:hypothetical protein